MKHIDKFASERLKQRRIAIGLSQKELGEALDISPIQIKKYEEGISTIPISRLYILSKVLNTSLKYFFNNTEEEKLETEDNLSDSQVTYLSNELDELLSNNVAEENADYEYDILFERENLTRTLERELLSLTRAFTKIQNANIRKIIIELVKTLALSYK
ncbi:MAG: helix-turn-helix transcriptional regulator [Rickettsia endosymbiont of Argas persicus]